MTVTYRASEISGLSSDTKPSNVAEGRIFLETDTAKKYIYTSGSWVELSAGGSEFNTFTTATTWNPSKQTGLTLVDIDTNSMTKGEIDVVIDGSTETVVSKNSTLNKFFNPSSSLALTTKQANYAFGDFASASSYAFPDASGLGGWQALDQNRGQWWNNDGTKFYFCGRDSAQGIWYVFQNTVSSANAWLFTTANDSFGGKSSALPNTPFANSYVGVSGLKDGGTKMYVIDKVNDSSTTGNAIIYRFDWSTAYDCTTCATSATNTWTVNDFSGQKIGMGWNNDGTKLFIYNTGNDTFYRYSLSTAWDLSTESLDSGQTKSGVTNANVCQGSFEFNSSGTRLYAKSRSNYNIYYTWSLSTAWDVTTISSSPILTFTTQGNGGQVGYETYYNDHYMTGGNGLYDFHRYQQGNGYIHTIFESYNGTTYSSVS